MEDKDNIEFKKRLAALFHMFRDKPHILVDYFINYGAVSPEFEERLMNSKKIEEAAKQMEEGKNMDKPYFKNVDDVQKYYNSFLNPEPETPIKESKPAKTHPLLGSNDEEVLRSQLEAAIEIEDYEKAAKIRDYMKKLGFEK